VNVLSEPGAESPPRPTVGHADKFNANQFESVIPAREKDLGYDAEADAQDFMNELHAAPAARHPNYIGEGQSLHQYRESFDGGFGKAKHGSQAAKPEDHHNPWGRSSGAGPPERGSNGKR
jgi:hypothetical protein